MAESGYTIIYDRLRVISNNIADKQNILKEIGGRLISSFQQSFKAQRRGSVHWKARGVPNIAGIISDLDKGSMPPKRRFLDRPALSDTDSLRDTIAMEINKDSVSVGSALPYATLHNVGGVTKKQITSNVRSNLYEFLKIKKNKKWQKELGWMFAKKFKNKFIKFNIVARPFAKIDSQDAKDIAKIVEGQIK